MSAREDSGAGPGHDDRAHGYRMHEELLHFQNDLTPADELLGMTVEALDGQVGKVAELVETERGTFLRVDTGPWIFGREIALPAGLVKEVDPAVGAVRVARLKEEIRNAPPLEAGDPVGEALVEYFAAAAAADLPADQRFASPQGSAPSGVADESTAEADTALTEPHGSSPAGQSDLGAPTERPPLPPEPASTDVGPTLTPPTQAAREEPAAPDAVTSSEREAPVEEETDEFAIGGRSGVEDAADAPERQDRFGVESRLEPTGLEAEPGGSAGGTLSPGVASDEAGPEPAIPDTEQEEEASGATAASPPRVEPADGATRPEDSTVSASVAPKRGGKARADRSERGRAKSSRDRRKQGEQPDLPIPSYETLSATEVQAKLRGLAQSELTKVERFERQHDNRRTVLQRIEALRGDEPWRGYDRQKVSEISQRLAKADEDRLRFVREYERRHKDRGGVLDAARRRLAAK